MLQLLSKYIFIKTLKIQELKETYNWMKFVNQSS